MLLFSKKKFLFGDYGANIPRVIFRCKKKKKIRL